jgi:hypothetical protein
MSGLIINPFAYGGGGGGGGSTYTLNPADKDANLVLSNSDRTVTRTGSNGHSLVRAIHSLPTSGKFQWEVKQEGTLANDRQLAALVAGSVATNVSLGGSPNGYVYDGINGQKYNNNVGTAFGSTYDNGDIITCLYDAGTLKFYFFKNYIPMNSGDPFAGTGQAFTLAAGTYYPGIGIYDVGGPATIALLETEQHYPLVDGYTDAAGNTSAPVSDANFSYNTALLPMNGSNGGTIWTDILGHTFTPSGTCSTDTSQHLFGGSSGKFTGGRIISASSADFGVGAGDFTVQGWHRKLSGGGGNECLMDTRTASNEGFALYASHSSASNCLTYINNSGSILLLGSVPFQVGSWTPWRVTKTGTTVKGFIWGAQVFTGTDSRTMASATTLSIGDNYLGGSQPINAHVQAFQFKKGLSLGTSAYTPQKVAFATS